MGQTEGEERDNRACTEWITVEVRCGFPENRACVRLCHFLGYDVVQTFRVTPVHPNADTSIYAPPVPEFQLVRLHRADSTSTTTAAGSTVPPSICWAGHPASASVTIALCPCTVALAGTGSGAADAALAAGGLGRASLDRGDVVLVPAGCTIEVSGPGADVFVGMAAQC